MNMQEFDIAVTKTEDDVATQAQWLIRMFVNSPRPNIREVTQR